jgi:hypothetical protein
VTGLFNKVQWGDGLTVTDEGNGVIRVDGGAGGGAGTIDWDDVGTGVGGAVLTTKGDVFGYDTAAARIPIGTTGQVLTADSTQTLGLKWATATGGGVTSPLTTKGDVWGYSTADARLPVGSNGQVLTADSAQTLGVKWAAAPAGGPKIYLSKPAGTITRASSTVGAFSTAWQITGVVVASGQNVILRVDPSSSVGAGNPDGIFAFARGGTVIASRIFNLNSTTPFAPRPLTWIDENPGAGTYTYEVQAAIFGGATLTVYQSTVTTDSGGGNSIFIAEVYTP